LGVTGSIACYKTAIIASKLTQKGADVTVIMTWAAQKFVSPLTFQTLTRNKVITDLFGAQDEYDPEHVALAKGCNLLVVAPATANILAKFATGIADDILSATFLAIDCPVIIAPAMNDRMYQHWATQANIKFLKEKGITFVGPEKGRLSNGTRGWGRMSDPEKIL
jgi:phosphopantothenoylcysteine decarboxylase/phosphopantothenate--cysteine ligase